MSLVNLAHMCSHLQNSSRGRLALTSVPLTKLHLALALSLHREGFLRSVDIGGPKPPETLLMGYEEPDTVAGVNQIGEDTFVDEAQAERDFRIAYGGEVSGKGTGEVSWKMKEIVPDGSRGTNEAGAVTVGAAGPMGWMKNKEREARKRNIGLEEARRLNSQSTVPLTTSADGSHNISKRDINDRHSSIDDSDAADSIIADAADTTNTFSTVSPITHYNSLEDHASPENIARNRHSTASPSDRLLLGDTLSAYLHPSTESQSADLPRVPTDTPLHQRPLTSLALKALNVPVNPAKRRLWLGLKYHNNLPVLSKLSLVSKPTRRIVVSSYELSRIVKGWRSGMIPGLTQPGESLFIGTERGIMEAREAVRRRIGGMVYCRAL